MLRSDNTWGLDLFPSLLYTLSIPHPATSYCSTKTYVLVYVSVASMKSHVQSSGQLTDFACKLLENTMCPFYFPENQLTL